MVQWPLIEARAAMSRARDHFTTIVRPTADEFLSNVRDIRRGFLAAGLLYHLVDYWDLENNPTKHSLDTMRQSLIKICPEFALIRDVADASKHAQLTRPVKPARKLSSSNQIRRSPFFVHAPFSEGAVFDENVGVLVKLDDGTIRPLSGIVRAVLSMWEDQLAPLV
jgi:hypothetical protein